MRLTREPRLCDEADTWRLRLNLGRGNESGNMQDASNTQSPAGQKPAFSSKQAEEIARYWNALADKANGIPDRADFDPIAIPSTLPTVFLIERLEDNTYKMRLQGTNFTERGIADLSGSVFTPDLTKTSHSPVYRLLKRVLETPCGLQFIGIERCENGRQALVEFSAFPLTDDLGVPRFVIGTGVQLATLGYEDESETCEPLVEVREVREIEINQLGALAGTE